MTERNRARTVPTTSSVATRCLVSTTCPRTAMVGNEAGEAASCFVPHPASASDSISAIPVVRRLAPFMNWLLRPGDRRPRSGGRLFGLTAAACLFTHAELFQNDLERTKICERRLQQIEADEGGEP